MGANESGGVFCLRAAAAPPQVHHSRREHIFRDDLRLTNSRTTPSTGSNISFPMTSTSDHKDRIARGHAHLDTTSRVDA